MEPIELEELGGSIVRSLPEETVTALRALDFLQLAYRPDGRWDVGLSGRKVTVGVVTKGGIDVFVRPKLPVRRILFLLGYATNPRWQRDQLIELEEEAEQQASNLTAAMAYVFVDQAQRALAQGALRGYIPVDDSLTVLRGRLREQEQLRRHHSLPIPLAVRFEDHTVDVIENQLLMTATRRLLRTPGIPQHIRARLRHLGRRTLAGVSTLDDAAPLPTWMPSRLNRGYHVVLPLAEVVLRGGSVDQAPGKVPLNGFLVNMDKVYEDFVTMALAEALRPYDGRSERPRRGDHHLDADRTIVIEPDLIWSRDSRRVAVVDAKYKREKKKSGFPNADVYQMLGYLEGLSVSEGHLVYAEGKPTTAQPVHQIGDKRITVHTLDLDTAPKDLLAQMEAVAERITAPVVTRA